MLKYLLLLLAGYSQLLGQQMPPLKIHPLTQGVYVHTSYQRYQGNPVPSNGLVLDQGDSLLWLDTGWDAGPTRELLAYCRDSLRKPVRACIATHAHGDRIGGALVLRAAGIPVWVTAQTLALAPDSLRPALSSLGHLTVGQALSRFGVEVFYAGAAHAPDNVVVWLPQARVLHGGCFIRAAASDNLGYVGEADLRAWPASLARVVQRYGSMAQHVVPGHGQWGGALLLQENVRLVARLAK